MLLLRTIDTGEANFEKDLRLCRWHIHVEQVHDLTGGRGNHHSAFGIIQISYGTAQEDHSVVLRDPDVLARQFRPQLAANAIEHVICSEIAWPDRDIEKLPAAALIPNDQAGLAGSFAAEKNLRWTYGLRHGIVTQTDDDARDRPSKIKDNRFTHRERQVVCRILTRRCRRLGSRRGCLGQDGRFGTEYECQSADTGDKNPSFSFHCFPPGVANLSSVLVAPLMTVTVNVSSFGLRGATRPVSLGLVAGAF